MTNADVARVFAEIADLLEIKGEDPFRVNSYRKVARSLEDLPTDVHELAARRELGQIPGVGKASEAKIRELLDTGRLTLRDELGREVPDTLLELRSIPTLGPKKIAALWKSCGVTSLQDLKAAIAAGKLVGLKNFGAKTIEQICQGINFVEGGAGRVRLGAAAFVADAVRQVVLGFPGVQRVEQAGSLRRGRDTIGDLDLLCTAADATDAIKRFTQMPGVTQILAAGGTKASVQFEYRPNRTLQIDLRVVPAESFGAAWQYFTGSKEHNVRLRELAVRRGWSLNEYGLTEGERVIASRTEEEIYAALGLPWIPPELREDRDEFALTETPRDLIALNDIRGDLHMHTTASDGIHTAAEMAAAARAMGLQYICITDHSQSSAIAGGLTPERLGQHVAEVRELAERSPGVALLAGAEVDILAEGRLDYPDELLAHLDFVVASIHSGMGQDPAANTKRALAAIRNPYVNVLAHPTGRLINKRPPMALDLEAVAKEAARTGTALEINSSTYRLDLKDAHARLARDLGATICINTDAHSREELDAMQFGVITARRANLRTADVLNTRPVAEVRAFVAAKRA